MAIVYWSQTGNTEAMAAAVADSAEVYEEGGIYRVKLCQNTALYISAVFMNCCVAMRNFLETL